MEKINRAVELQIGMVRINVTVKKNLKAREDVLKNWGYIEVTDGGLESDSCFYDNLDFFMNCTKKGFQEECKEELKDKGYDWRETYKEIKKLIKEAVRLKILTPTEPENDSDNN